MHEYEFRLVVESHTSFLPLIQNMHPVKTRVIYLKPHFRFRDGVLETKRIESVKAVYHDGLWLRWVHSIETPYRKWSRSTCETFLHSSGNFQDPFHLEHRHVVSVDSKAKLYTFQKGPHCFRLVFEWEFGCFSKPLKRFDPDRLLGSLSRYGGLFDLMKTFPPPPSKLDEFLTRRPVRCIETIPEGNQYLYANKLDGTFGLVYSYRDKVKEKWEGYECVVRKNVSLGDGLVFAAERLEGGPVFLLDVYQVRGHATASWCRRGILKEFLPKLKLVEGYFVQTYVSDKRWLSQETPFKTDGIIIHDVINDNIFKYKPNHSIDLVYFHGYFYLPNGRIKCLTKGLEEKCVYEISTQNGEVIRKRPDRFKGNTADQLENVMKNGWYGPPIEPLPPPKKGGRSKVK